MAGRSSLGGVIAILLSLYLTQRFKLSVQSIRKDSHKYWDERKYRERQKLYLMAATMLIVPRALSAHIGADIG
jgi:membrane protein YqaA with SNARE-associated domain